MISRRAGPVGIYVTGDYELSEFQEQTWGMIVSLRALVFGFTCGDTGSRVKWIRVYLGWWCVEVDCGPDV